MADKSHATGAAGRTTAAGQPESVRNVVLVGHSGAGKTTLAEALLVTTGAIQREGRVEEGTTVSDFDEVEIRQQRSVNLTLVPFVHAGVKVNLLDTPGYADFTGDLRAGLRAADAALFTVSAADGIDGLTQMLWDECAAVGTPRAVVITKIDHQRGDFDEALAACRAAFGDSVAPLYLPVSDGQGGVKGLIGLLSQRFYDYSGESRADTDVPADEADRVAEARGALIESIIQESEDETLMDSYLSGEEIDVKGLIEDLETAVARGSFYPVLASSAPPLLAEVVKTTSDPYVGRVSLVRVFSGTLRPDATVHVSGHGRASSGHADHDEDERVGALTSPLGKQQRTISQCPAGDICAVAKLGTAETGDTLSDKEKPLLMEPWAMPEPLLPIAIQAKSKADEDKMSQALARLVAEDPTLRLENNAETRQLVLWCMGEAHADLALDRLSNRYGVAVETVELRVPLSSSTRSSAAWCRASSSRPSRRAYAPRWSRASWPATRWWTSGSLCSTARHTRSTPLTWRSRRPAAPPSATRPPRRTSHCSSRSTRYPSSSRTTTWARSCPTCRRAAAVSSAPSPWPAAAPWSRRRSPSWRSSVTPLTCARCPTGRARSPVPTCATSRFRRTWRRRWRLRKGHRTGAGAGRSRCRREPVPTGYRAARAGKWLPDTRFGTGSDPTNHP